MGTARIASWRLCAGVPSVAAMTSHRVLSPPVLLLAAVAFTVGTAEFAAIGLVPQVAADLGTSIAAAGSTVTSYALAVGLTAVPLGLLLARRAPRPLLVGLLLVFAAANVLNALSPSLVVLVVGRVVSAAAQGVALGTVVAAAAALVAPEQRARAVATAFGGLMTAMVLGAPLGTALGGAVGWRWTFVALAVLAVVLAGALAVRLPAVPVVDGPPQTLRALTRRQVVVPIAIATAVLLSAAVLFTYLGAYLDRVAGIGTAGVSIGLAVYGLAGLAGNALGGALPARPAVLPALAAVAAAAVALLALAGAVLPVALVAVAVWGVAQMALLPIVTARAVEHGGGLAATANVAAVNLGLAVGGFVGAPLADTRIEALPWVTAAGLLAVAVTLAAAGVLGAGQSARKSFSPASSRSTSESSV